MLTLREGVGMTDEGADDEMIFHRNVKRLRESQETLALRVSREHYLWLADRITELSSELSHFANRA